MPKFGLRASRTSFTALAASMVTVAALALPAAATSNACISSGKCYLAGASPATITAGTTGSFVFTVTNEATTQELGSLEIIAPAGFVITGASGPASGTASYTPDSALFRYLSLAPGQSATLTVQAAAPCGGGTYQWATEAKQSNQFNGTGNDFGLDPASNLSGSVTGACSLKVTSQPNDTVAGAPITTAVGSAGGPVQVAVLDGSGLVITNSTAAVTMAIGADPGSGSLSGTATVDANGGVASFSDLSIASPGLGYTLIASSPGITPIPATSAAFNIESELARCPATPCTASSSTRTTTGTVSTPSASSSDYLGVGLGGVSYTCPSYTRSSAPVSFDVLSPSGAALSTAQFTVQLEVSKSTVQASGHPGASTWQICYASAQPFTAVPGTSGTVVIGGETYYTGLLPGCPSTSPVAPCLQAQNKDNAGDVVVTFLATGDPVGFA